MASAETLAMIVLGCGGLIALVVLLVRGAPVEPDPWEDQVDEDELTGKSSQACLNCLAPVVSHGQHYCPHCGQVTGEYTRYVPFVNIPFNYSLFRTLWRRVRSAEVRPSRRIVAVVVIAALAPSMLVIGVPLLLVERMRSANSEK